MASLINEVQDSEEPRQTYPSIDEYNFSVDLAGLIAYMGQMGQTVRWPRKSYKPNPRRDPTKRCDFHDDIGHTTEDCNTLKKKVSVLLQKGYLKELIKKSDSRSDPMVVQESHEPVDHTVQTKEVNLINGGSGSM